MINWKQDFSLAVVLFCLAVAFYGVGLTYPDITVRFPSKLSPLLGLLAILLGVAALRRRDGIKGQQLANWKALRAPALLLLLTAVFIALLPYIGFFLSSLLFSSSIFFGLGHPDKKIALIVAVVASASIYFIFHLALGVSLPVGSLWIAE